MTRKHLIEFIRKQKTAFVSSVDGEGFPNIKAMFTPRKIDGNCFYLSTNTSSMRTQQYLKNSKASLYFYQRGPFCYEGIMLIGMMEVLQDLDIKQELWQNGDTMYYPGGVTDPDYCVLKFTAQKGRRYRSLKNEDFNMNHLK
ncbi:MAG: pyridoxamine 5'-phosphate oxidase family protein [Lachnospiraceae bacterium]|nr:pyridoxamine 5'-phosphate oxidase family protein [Lachnospiraceae bacterium]MDE7006647.1 pyridoxamine 5'-phosphate oxidase family protein [Lachnospiraceae bacterium]